MPHMSVIFYGLKKGCLTKKKIGFSEDHDLIFGEFTCSKIKNQVSFEEKTVLRIFSSFRLFGKHVQIPFMLDNPLEEALEDIAAGMHDGVSFF